MRGWLYAYIIFLFVCRSGFLKLFAHDPFHQMYHVATLHLDVGLTIQTMEGVSCFTGPNSFLNKCLNINFQKLDEKHWSWSQESFNAWSRSLKSGFRIQNPVTNQILSSLKIARSWYRFKLQFCIHHQQQIFSMLFFRSNSSVLYYYWCAIY